MTKADIGLLSLDYPGLRERYEACFDNDIGPAWLVYDEEAVFAAFGALFLWDGCCEVWLSIINNSRPIATVRAIREEIERQAAELKIHRMHAMVAAANQRARRLVEHLGFRNETPFGMRSYNPDGSAAYMYARVF